MSYEPKLGWVSPSPALLSGGPLRSALLRYVFTEPDGCLAVLEVTELPQLAERIGAHAEVDLAVQLTSLVAQCPGALCVGYGGEGRIWFILRGVGAARETLHKLALRVVDATFQTTGATVRLSPALGYVPLKLGGTLEVRKQRALEALAEARRHDDLYPVCYKPPVIASAAFAQSRAYLAAGYERIKTPLQIGVTLLFGVVLPFFAYVGLARIGFDVSAPVYIGTVIFLLLTSYLIWYEGFKAIHSTQPPTEPLANYPAASAVIAAYLPNEAATIVETVHAFLKLSYPGTLEVIIAYNTPRDLPVEEELRALVQQHPQLRLLRVAGSTSKAQNVNAALAIVSGELVGIFDADHHPAADSFTRAWHWLAHGYDAVQGHCVIRNGDETWVSRLVAVEFETIYAVAHPGRARIHDFGIFGGSNGYWRTSVLRRIRMRGSMLTEDIDASLRATLAGHKIASDPLLISRELAPLTLASLWNQRMRWAQGWFQVTRTHLWAALRAPTLSLRQKFGMVHLLLWRELYPWISLQIVTVLSFWIWLYGFSGLNWLIPIFILTTILTFSSGPGQVLFGYLLGAPEIRRQRGWYVGYLLLATLFYTELKNLISRVAMIKEALQEKKWKVTPREARRELVQKGAES